MSQRSLLTALAIEGFVNMAVAQGNCSPTSFQDLSLFGGRILNVATVLHSNLSLQVSTLPNFYTKNVTNLDACEVLVTYTHPGYNDTINTAIWLPSAEHWTGRFLGEGGGGWATGAEDSAPLIQAASEGFAVVSTDGGHDPLAQPSEWALSSPGNLNWPLIQDFASISLNDAATLGKAVVKAYYGRAPSYSYWNGCSQGGRQGHMMAQRYPEQYDGILATAAATYWGQIMMEFFWPQAVMNDLGEYPTPCEIEAIHLATIKACDSIDGLADGIILSSDDCQFDPMTIVGEQHACLSTNGTATITEAAAVVAKETWKGATSPEGEFLWHGLDKSARLFLQAGTTCSNGTCVGLPVGFPVVWIKYFLALDPAFDTTTVNTTQFDYLFHQSVNHYDSILGTSDSDLTYFNKAGGKLINWHGSADPLLGPKYTEHYVRAVYERDPNASDYYRYFEAPGLEHCGATPVGFYPGDAMKSLIDWVEKGIAPETLKATTRGDATTRTANLCLWPKKMVYVGGDDAEATSFACR